MKNKFSKVSKFVNISDNNNDINNTREKIKYEDIIDLMGK
jgi:hypothetical protein